MGRGVADKSSLDVLSLKHGSGVIQGVQLVYGAEAHQRDFQARVLIEAENGAMGRAQVGLKRREEASRPHLEVGQGLGRWEGTWGASSLGSQGTKEFGTEECPCSPQFWRQKASFWTTWLP